ncbi:Alpha-type protein kinase domain-containing protein [Mycena indigotica]|uniref:Alpha-type protein kinase domain-containing protein n=1 Tax=Mycena indigotica TaxID=2126181 RepID=A0A8H6S5R6_9AGAR|nr:Alpha-type protein kinase domain-containing protein [Mycena indigotica]KAF7293615.1 Alpha-type protein kinase domain-containing protein [Mycena indigotica]
MWGKREVNDGKEDRRVVVKRVYRASDDDDRLSTSSNVTAVQNRALLEADCVRISLGRKLLADFFSYAKEMDVAIFTAIEFTPAYLATEKSIQVTRAPSVASDLESFDSSGDGITWLVEDKRAAAVIQFTSTLNHKARGTDLQTLTIHSFAHYVFGATNGTLVMADIQGTPATVRGNDGLILFDIMTHTPDGGSGLGDFGMDGIESFVNSHQCNQLCKRLEFDEVFPLELAADVLGPDVTDGSEGGITGDDNSAFSGDDQA